MTSSAMPWIKLYTEALDDPKLGRLTDAQKWRFVSLCLLAGECDQNGALVNGEEPMSEEDIAWRLRVPYDELCTDLQALYRSRLVTRDGEAWIVSHFAQRQGRPQSEKRADWRDRQDAHRDKSKDVTRDSRVSHASRQDQDQDQDTDKTRAETDSRQEGAAAPDVAAAVVAVSVEAALDEYRVTGTKADAMRADAERFLAWAAYYRDKPPNVGNVAGLVIRQVEQGKDPPRRRDGNNGHRRVRDSFICPQCNTHPCVCEETT